MRRTSRGGRGTPGGPSHAIGLDAGASTLRVWAGSGADPVEAVTSVVGARTVAVRAEATGPLIHACRDELKRHLPRHVRHSRTGFAVAVAVPATASSMARRRVESIVSELNCGQPVLLMDAPLAAAAGSGLDISGTAPHLLLDVGVHGSEVALLAEGRLRDALAISRGCQEIERAVLAYLYRRHHLRPPGQGAGHALRLTPPTGGSAVPTQGCHPELAARLSSVVAEIAAGVWRLAGRAGQRIGHDALEHGLMVVGGGAAASQLLAMLSAELRCPVVAAVDPRRAIVRGLGELLCETRRYPQIWVTR